VELIAIGRSIKRGAHPDQIAPFLRSASLDDHVAQPVDPAGEPGLDNGGGVRLLKDRGTIKPCS